jgi:hypothetical protein
MSHATLMVPILHSGAPHYPSEYKVGVTESTHARLPLSTCAILTAVK